MKVKLIAVLVAVAAIFIGAVLWRTDSFVYGDRMSWVEAQTRTQVGAINHSMATELKTLQRVVATLNSENFQKGKLNWNAMAPYYAAASFSVNGGNLEPQVIVAKENSKAANWTTEFVKSAVGNIANRTSDLRFYVKPFQDSQRGRYVALVFLEGSKAYALFGSGEIFQSVIDAQRGALSSFSIVTSTGLTVGHSVPEYLGTVMRDDPVFKEAQKSGSSHGSNTFQLKSGDLYGMYEMIPQSNLLVLSSAPLKETMKGRTGLWWQFLLMGAGLMTVAAAALLWLTTTTEKQITQLEDELQAAKSRPLAPPVPEKVIAQDPEVVQKEKVQASMKVASALAHEMRGPLASILGYSQMILAKSPETDIVQSTESILRETRAARGVLDKLLGYAGEEVQEKNSMKVEGPLVKALKEMEPLFAQKGVKLTKNIQDNSALDLHVDAIMRAISNVLHNSVEAMERMPKKEIKVDLFEDADGVHLNIEDTGEGIEAANVDKIFDPFFTTRSFHNHMGLGLSVAFGILKEHNADVRVESQRGQGTKVNILFKKVQSVSVLKAPADVLVAKEEPLVISPELPKLSEESAHQEEAKAHYEEVKASSAPASPLDVNIDNLLELPEATEVAPPPAQAEEVKAESSHESLKPKISTPIVSTSSVKASQPAAPALGNDEFSFIDGFLGEEPKAPQAKTEEAPATVSASAAEPVLAEVVTADEVATTIDAAPVAEPVMAPTPEELATMSDELTPVNFVMPPQMTAKAKTTKLDTYHVEIRRPGKRL
ncbi:two-component sensor histidine kinase [Bdellovibrio bacteriovorus]|uniref:histidine kinase n=1 Tax=Bdellovibrio bacteriovorus TaxID=959 RepID=A0A150WG37_BDEBC|nr:HAMP domain-containing sensor histidine kinase [Bdellovibrio bacteriovorus]KYG62087.1 two-component sensor histidine kinase [Bdellovibrio bacteriovorus]